MAHTPLALRRIQRPYAYEKLYSLTPGISPVNVMGVVVLFKPPYQSKGRDYTCTMEIVDEGCQNCPVPLIFFNRDMQKLPQSCNIGDVVCVRRVDVGEFNYRIQGKCQSQCSWMRWDGSKEWKRGPVATSVGTSWGTAEANRVRLLITWSTSSLSQCQGSESSQSSSVARSPLKATSVMSISDVRVTEQKINVIGVVKSVSVPQKSRGRDYFVSVVLIDETAPVDGLPFTMFNPVESLLPKFGNPGSVAYLINVNKVIDYEGSLLGFGHERSRVVSFSLQPNDEMTSTASAGNEVPSDVRERARALLEWVASAQPSLSVVEDSELLDTPSQSQCVLPLDLPHTPTATLPSTTAAPPTPANEPNNYSNATERSRFIPPTFLTVVLHPTWEISTLGEVQNCQSVPSCFHVRVKVLQVLQPLNECCQLRCTECKYRFSSTDTQPCTECDNCARIFYKPASPPKLRYMYCLSLLIGDTSATCQAHLSDTDADEFFQDMSPADLNESPAAGEALLNVLTTLAGRPDPFLVSSDSSLLTAKAVPWIDCCVQTYNSCEGVQLRIVDTLFLK